MQSFICGVRYLYDGVTNTSSQSGALVSVKIYIWEVRQQAELQAFAHIFISLFDPNPTHIEIFMKYFEGQEREDINDEQSLIKKAYQKQQSKWTDWHWWWYFWRYFLNWPQNWWYPKGAENSRRKTGFEKPKPSKWCTKPESWICSTDSAWKLIGRESRLSGCWSRHPTFGCTSRRAWSYRRKIGRRTSSWLKQLSLENKGARCVWCWSKCFQTPVATASLIQLELQRIRKSQIWEW